MRNRPGGVRWNPAQSGHGWRKTSAQAAAITIDPMTTKERLHKLVDELSEREADETLRLMAARRQGANVDGWGDLDATTDKTTARITRDLTDEERKAGLTPWRP
jgi:hypothetical protein